MLTPPVRAATAAEIPADDLVRERITGRIVLLDGTPAPVCSWAGHREPWAGKLKRTGFDFHVICDAFGQLIAISKPVEGCAHELRALQESGLKDLLAPAEAVFADKGYRGTGCFIPRRKPDGGEPTDEQKRYNTQIIAIRAPVERAIANIKTWRVLHTDYRRALQPSTTASTPPSASTGSRSTHVLHRPHGPLTVGTVRAGSRLFRWGAGVSVAVDRFGL